MTNKFKTNKLWKRMAAFVMTVLVAVGSMSASAQAAIPQLSTSRYMKAHVLSWGNNTPVYTNSNLNVRGTASPYKRYSATVYSSDEIYIFEMNAVYAVISYPVGNTRRKGYVRTSDITSNNYSKGAKRSAGYITTYERAGGAKYGNIDPNDWVYTLASVSGYKQIAYECGTLWKLAFVTDADYNRYLTDSTSSADLSGYYQLKSSIDRNYALDVYGGWSDDCANIQLYQNHGGDNQWFKFEKQSDGYYKIIAKHSGKLLDVYENQTCNGANIIQCIDNGGDNQKWKVEKDSQGYYSFVSKSNGLYINVAGGYAGNEINVCCYQGNGSPSQKFILEPASGSNQTASNPTYNNSADKLVEMAKTQLGIKENWAGSDNIKYNDWYYGRSVYNGDNPRLYKNGFYPWCATFVSWCAKETGLLNSVIPSTASTTNMKDGLLSKGGVQHLKGSGYMPQKGDIIFFGSNAGSHVGIVDYSSGNTVYYIDGNNTTTSPHGVHYSSCSLSKSDLWGFVTPAY